MKTAPKCKKCKGTGVYPPYKMDSRTPCPLCEGSGIKLLSEKEEEFNEYSEMTGDKIHQDEDNYVDFEEEDYQP